MSIHRETESGAWYGHHLLATKSQPVFVHKQQRKKNVNNFTVIVYVCVEIIGLERAVANKNFLRLISWKLLKIGI